MRYRLQARCRGGRSNGAMAIRVKRGVHLRAAKAMR